MNCYVYIDLNSPQRDPSESPKAGGLTSKTKSHPHQSKEKERHTESKHHSGSSKKLTRSRKYEDSVPEPEEKILEKKVKLDKPSSKVPAFEKPIIREKSPERQSKASFPDPPTKIPKSRTSERKKPVDSEKLSLDDYIKQIEQDLNLTEFASKTETYEKDLNFIEENIHENKVIEEFKEEEPKKEPKKPIAEKSHTPEKKSMERKKPESKSKEVESDHLREKATKENQETATIQNKTPSKDSSEQLLQETILQMKQLKKQHQKSLASSLPKSLPSVQDLKKFLTSPDHHPNQPHNKLSGFPKNLSTLRKTQQYAALRELYSDFRLAELKDQEYACDVCLKKESEEEDLILICDLCDGAIHQKCYGSELARFLPEGNWYCSRCKFLIDHQLQYSSVKCIFCPELKGIIKMINGSEFLWGHISCVLQLPIVSYLDGKEFETVTLEKFYKNKAPTRCTRCDISYGACVKCSDDRCDKTFHVSCGHRQGLIFRFKDRLQNLCRNHQNWLPKKLKGSLQRKYENFTQMPEKYSLMLDKSDYEWVEQTEENPSPEEEKKGEAPQEQEERDFFINLADDVQTKNQNPNPLIESPENQGFFINLEESTERKPLGMEIENEDLTKRTEAEFEKEKPKEAVEFPEIGGGGFYVQLEAKVNEEKKTDSGLNVSENEAPNKISEIEEKRVPQNQDENQSVEEIKNENFPEKEKHQDSNPDSTNAEEKQVPIALDKAREEVVQDQEKNKEDVEKNDEIQRDMPLDTNDIQCSESKPIEIMEESNPKTTQEQSANTEKQPSEPVEPPVVLIGKPPQTESLEIHPPSMQIGRSDSPEKKFILQENVLLSKEPAVEIVQADVQPQKTTESKAMGEAQPEKPLQEVDLPEEKAKVLASEQEKPVEELNEPREKVTINELCKQSKLKSPKLESQVFVEADSSLENPAIQQNPSQRSPMKSPQKDLENKSPNISPMKAKSPLKEATNEKKPQVITIDAMEIEEEKAKNPPVLLSENGEVKSGFVLNLDRPKLYRDVMAIFSEAKMDL